MRGMVEYVTHAVLDLHRDMPAYRRAQQRRRVAAAAGEDGRRAARRRARPGLARPGGAGAARRLRLRLRRLEPLAPCDRRRALPCRRRRAGRLPRAHRHPRLPAAADRCDARLPERSAVRAPAAAARASCTSAAGRSSSCPTCSLRSTPAVSPRRCSTSPIPSRCRPRIRLWSHPRVRITPHIASMTQPASAARVVIDNLRRFARRRAAGRPGRSRARAIERLVRSTICGKRVRTTAALGCARHSMQHHCPRRRA